MIDFFTSKMCLAIQNRSANKEARIISESAHFQILKSIFASRYHRVKIFRIQILLSQSH